MPSLPTILPMPLQTRPEPFDHVDWFFELKYDGFRALAHIDSGKCKLVSRNGNVFKSFQSLADRIGAVFPRITAVLDGELVCLDHRGHPQFNELLYRRQQPIFVAFDLLFSNNQDLRCLPLIERKLRLRSLLHGHNDRVLYVDHVEAKGVALFERVCALDLEGIVAKNRWGTWVGDREASTWFKVRNRSYSQMVGRAEKFERDRHQEPVAGWHSCSMASAEWAIHHSRL